MKVLRPGHVYSLDQLDSEEKQELTFVSRAPLHEVYPGVQNQEVLRVLINRVKFLDREVSWPRNVDILKHLRLALVLHEVRALERKVQKEKLFPEYVEVNPKDGHFILVEN